MCKNRSLYDEPQMPCPYCGKMCNADFVDIGVAMQQCGPYHCEACGAVEIGPTTKPNRPLTDKEREAGWLGGESKALTPLQQRVASMFKDLVSVDFMEASNHSGSCKCQKCLQWWVQMGPEETSYGWSFGPFSKEEFTAAGGVVPDEQMTESEVISQWMGGGELW